MMIDTGMRVPPRGRGMASSHGPGSGAPDTARRGPRMLNSSGGNTPGNLPFDTMPKDRPGMISMQQQPARNRMRGGMVDPGFRNMMAFKNSGGMNNPFNQQYKAQYGPGAFGVSSDIYNQHFDQGGMPRQPQQQEQGPWGGMFGGMNPYGMGMFNPYGMMGGMGQMGGINTGPSPMMMRQFNMGGMFPNRGMGFGY